MTGGCRVDKTPLGEKNGENGGNSIGGDGFISIAALKAMYINRPVTVSEEVSIRGRVVSSDRWGNFYKTLCLEDDSGGIAVRVDLEEYFRVFGLGDIVTVYCNTLTLGTYGGAIQLGVLSSDVATQVTYIPEHYLLSSVGVTVAEAEPSVTVTSIDRLAPSLIHCYVELRDVQFEQWEEGMTWCDEDTDTDRTLVDREGNRLAVRTSGYATFASGLLPSGSGTVRGVVGYFNGSYQLTLVNAHYAMMDGDRF